MVKWASKLIVGWALFGGVILLLLVIMTTYSAAAGFLIATPFPGDFELTEMGVAVASFAFLPYCQLTFANVSADVFTAKMKPAKVRFFKSSGLFGGRSLQHSVDLANVRRIARLPDIPRDYDNLTGADLVCVCPFNFLSSPPPVGRSNHVYSSGWSTRTIFNPRVTPQPCHLNYSLDWLAFWGCYS